MQNFCFCEVFCAFIFIIFFHTHTDEEFAVLLPPPSGHSLECHQAQSGEDSFTCTFLSRHFDRDAVAERAFAFACRVHLVLDAAVDDPKLDLRPTKKTPGLMCCGRTG